MSKDDGRRRCIIADCGNIRNSRGLCQTCYQRANRLIGHGQVKDWAELEGLGLALPPRAGSMALDVALKRARAKSGRQA